MWKRKRGLLRFMMSCLFIQNSFLSHAQSYNFKNYSVENGLPFIQISAIYQDEYGYLWSGGYGGLSRFNGFKFDNYSPKQGLSNHFVTSITADKDHNLWVGTIQGLSVFKENKFATYTTTNGLADNKINCLITDKKGKLIAGTEKGLCYFVDGKFELIKALKNKTITCLADDAQNNLFIGTEKGIYRLKGQKLDSLNTPGLYDKKINALEIDNTGNVWAGTEKGLLTFDADLQNITNYHVNNGLIEENIACLNIDYKNNVWIGTQSGLMKFDGARFNYYRIAIDMNSNYIVCLNTDYEQNLWIGTHAGLYKFRDEGFVNFGPHDGLDHPLVFPILRDTANDLWVGTDRGGLYRYSGNTFYNYTTRNGLAGDTVHSLIEDVNKNLWIGTSRGISMYKNKKFLTVSSTKDKFVHGLFRDKKGNVWAGFDSELACIKVDYKTYETSPVFYKLPTPIHNYQVWAFVEDHAGNIWVGSYLGGLYKFDGKKFTCMNEALNIKSTDIVSLQYNANDNKIYIASFEGVYEIDPVTNKTVHFSELDGLSSDLVYVVLLTDKGNTLWAGTNQGANKIDLGEYKQSGRKNSIAYGKADGFKGVESNSNGAFLDKDNSVWFGTVNGLIKYSPQQYTENLQEARLTITGIRLFYTDTVLPNGVVLDPSLNNISIHYTAICLTNPDKIKYIHKLEGFEKSWSPESKESFTTYSNLPPGTYTYKVRSCNNAGIWNLEPLTFSFTISKPYWMRWWFVLSLIVLIACIIIVIFQIRVNQVRKAQKKEAEQQIAISKNELKALRAQMNPHFMFNSLNSIQHYIINNKDDEAIFYLNKFARLMRMILNHSEKVSITIREELDALKLYLELEQMRFQNKFTYEIIVDENIDPEYEHVPTMLMQPYIENAILHGLTPKKEPGKLSIEIRYQGKYIVCSITDNGIGREQSASIKAHRPMEHKSLGMKITQDRLKLLNNINQSDLSMKITDLKNAEGLAMGTKVDIFIPVS